MADTKPWEDYGGDAATATAEPVASETQPWEDYAAPAPENKPWEDFPAQAAPVEEIKTAPTIVGELEAGRYSSALGLARNAIEDWLKPTQPSSALRKPFSEPGSLLGTTERIPYEKNDSIPMAQAKAVVNWGNSFMAGLTSPEMVSAAPLAYIPGVGPAYAADIASHLPDRWQQVQEADKTAPYSPERTEAGLGMIGDILMIAGGAKAGEAAKIAPIGTETIPTEPQIETKPPDTAFARVQPQMPVESPEAVSATLTQPELETQPETARATVETPLPEGIGVAERYREEYQPGSVEPGTIQGPDYWRQQGRDWINRGGDPEAVVARPGVGDPARNVGIVGAEYERLAQETGQAADALADDPGNSQLKSNLDAATKAQFDWSKKMQPVLTKASEALGAARGTVPIDEATYQGLYQKAIDFTNGRDLTDAQKVQVFRRSTNVAKARRAENAEMANFEETLRKELPTRGTRPVPTDVEMAAEVDRMVRDLTPCR